jgi:hypothetical protein
MYNWLLNNQYNSNSIVFLGIFNHLEIVTNIDKQKAFELYQKADNLKICLEHVVWHDVITLVLELVLVNKRHLNDIKRQQI